MPDPSPTNNILTPNPQDTLAAPQTAAQAEPSGPAESKRLARPERGERLTITTDTFAFEGKAVGRREDGYVIFVEGALAGETIEVEVTRPKGRYAEAKLTRVLEPSPDRRTPICPYFGTCGGCALQHMAYDSQLFWKKQQVIDLFQRIGKVENPRVKDVLGALATSQTPKTQTTEPTEPTEPPGPRTPVPGPRTPAPGSRPQSPAPGSRSPAPPSSEFHYRNKMEFSFSEERWLTEEEIDSDSRFDRFALGLHVRNRFNRVIDTKVCFLPAEIVVDILNFTRSFAREHNLGVYAPDANPEGLLRFLVVKTSHATGEIMVNLVTSREDKETLERFTRELRATVPGITTVVNNINGRRAQVAVGDREICYFGDGSIRDTIGPATYQISANSFFQANTPQAVRLYQVAADFAELRPDDVVWDLYCGTGTISLFVAHQVKEVLGIELVEAAIADAEANAKANGVKNVEFVASDLRHALTTPEFLDRHARPNVMIIDPPRSGMHADVVREVLTLAPQRIAYISCNPATQARDIEMMSEFYDLVELQPVDMFPQTYHIECVAKLVRKS